MREYEEKVGKKKDKKIAVLNEDGEEIREDGGDGGEEGEDGMGISRNIHETINMIPELTKKKEKMDMHSKIAWALLGMIIMVMMVTTTTMKVIKLMITMMMLMLMRRRRGRRR